MTSSTSSTRKKRGRSNGGITVFSAVDALNAQDVDRERKQSTAESHGQDLRRRSRAALLQTEMSSSLLECRILLQRAIQSQANITKEQEMEAGPDDRDDQSNHVLIHLLRARQAIANNDETFDYDGILESGDLALEDRLQTEYENYRESWKEVLNRRQKDVRLHSGALTNKTQFRVIDSSFWHQVESTAQHEQVRELQLQEQEDRTGHFRFDDAKVYQNMLKDFLSDSSQAVAGKSSAQAVTLAAQQRLAGKKMTKSTATTKKAQVDRKASKGRKIRYTDIPKLTNFTFPLSRPNSASGESLANLDEEAWFRSLFGGSEFMR